MVGVVVVWGKGWVGVMVLGWRVIVSMNVVLCFMRIDG